MTKQDESGMNRLIIKLFLVLGCLLACLPTGNAQRIYTGDLEFTSYSSLERFFQKHPECRVIKGSVSISEVQETGLKPLSNLEEIDGVLEIYDCPNISHLSDIEQINLKSIYISDMEGLVRFPSLKNLDFVDFWVENCPRLRSIEHLNKVTTIKGALMLRDLQLSVLNLRRLSMCPSPTFDNVGPVKSIDLTGITTANDLTIVNNSKLETIHAYFLKTIKKELRVEQNLRLTRIETTVESIGRISVNNNELLEPEFLHYVDVQSINLKENFQYMVMIYNNASFINEKSKFIRDLVNSIDNSRIIISPNGYKGFHVSQVKKFLEHKHMKSFALDYLGSFSLLATIWVDVVEPIWTPVDYQRKGNLLSDLHFGLKAIPYTKYDESIHRNYYEFQLTKIIESDKQRAVSYSKLGANSIVKYYSDGLVVFEDKNNAVIARFSGVKNYEQCIELILSYMYELCDTNWGRIVRERNKEYDILQAERNRKNKELIAATKLLALAGVVYVLKNTPEDKKTSTPPSPQTSSSKHPGANDSNNNNRRISAETTEQAEKTPVEPNQTYGYNLGDKVWYAYEGDSGYEGVVMDRKDGRYLIKVTRVTVDHWLKSYLSATECSGNVDLKDDFSTSELNRNKDGRGALIWVPKSCFGG
jgi:hypothetical protein